MISVQFMERAVDFLDSLNEKARKKIIYNIHKVARGDKDKEVFKKLEGTDIWEFRTLYGGIAYRLLAFWDTETDTLIIATNGFIKKTQKTPTKEISIAEQLKYDYFNNK